MRAPAWRISCWNWGCGWFWWAWGARKDTTAPFTQYHLADALGLSAVHVNRVLRQLREAELVTVRDGRVTFHDLDRLVGFAEFDPAYLDDAGPLLK